MLVGYLKKNEHLKYNAYNKLLMNVFQNNVMKSTKWIRILVVGVTTSYYYH